MVTQLLPTFMSCLCNPVAPRRQEILIDSGSRQAWYTAAPHSPANVSSVTLSADAGSWTHTVYLCEYKQLFIDICAVKAVYVWCLGRDVVVVDVQSWMLVTTGQTLTTTSSGMSRHDSANSYHHSNYAVITAGLLRDVLVHLLNQTRCQVAANPVWRQLNLALSLLLGCYCRHGTPTIEMNVKHSLWS